MKKLLVFFTLLMLLLACSVPAMASDINVTVDGEQVVWTDAQPFIDANSRTLVPLRAVADALGLEVEWNAAARQAIFSCEYGAAEFIDDETGYWLGEIKLIFTIDNSTAAYSESWYNVDGTLMNTVSESVAMDTAAIINGSRTYAPIRYLAESFGYDVSWDAATRTASLDYSVDYAVYYDCFSSWPTAFGIYYSCGESYDEIKSFSVNNVKVNGVAAGTEIFSADELAELNNAFFDANVAVYAFNIIGSYTAKDDGSPNTYVFTWDTNYVFTDGSTKTEQYTWTWDCVGSYGGY